MENIELWKDFVDGNAEAYSQIYRIYYPVLYSYGLKLAAGDQELVKDVIQELFIKLILNHSNLYATQHVSAYLLAAFRHKLIDAIQSMHPRESIEYIENSFFEEEMPDFIAEEDSNGGADDEYLVNKKKLMSVYSKLPGRQREILYLYYVKELSHREISDIMEINIQSSKNLLGRSVIKIRKLFFT